MKLDRVIRIVEEFRSGCLSKYPRDYDPMDPDIRKRRIGTTFADPFFEGFFAEELDEPIYLIAKIAESPRQLKMILSRVNDAWDALHGEVDFDDLLVMLCLQHAAPEAFAFIVTNLNKIMMLRSGRKNFEDKDRKEPLQKEWDETVAKTFLYGCEAEQLVQFLFPFWDREYSMAAGDVPQGVRHSEPVDYFERISKQELSVDEIRDQDVLAALLECRDGSSNPSVNGLPLPRAMYESESLSRIIEHFGFILSGENVREVAGQLIACAIDDQGKMAQIKKTPGLTELWRLSLEKPNVMHKEWFTRQLERILPVSLRFASEFYCFWRFASDVDREMRTPFIGLRQIKDDTLRRIWQANPSIIAASIDPQYIFALYQLVIGFDKSDQVKVEESSSDWLWLIDVMAAAVKEDGRIASQLAPFVVTNKDQFSDDLVFQPEEAELIFPGRTSDVLRLISESGCIPEGDTVSRRWAQFARDAALAAGSS